ncbi:MarR family winged helix-turn-helix transcriptional regulator [Agromyces sp. NPDC056965]|uniref:MarR family winged helix-turn-helix transcriptional regulator n=1 Tax=Agromyces sp. NPDC056965 TaxID=3345983 RepID=UPI0036457CE9
MGSTDRDTRAPRLLEQDASLQRVAITLRELAWTIHRRAPERAHVGPIPTTEVALLKQVVDGPGATVGELARTLGLRQSNTSAALRSLEGRGLITRESSAADRRVVRIWATPDGVREHEAIADAWSADVIDAVAALPERERASIEAATEALALLHELMRKRAELDRS